MDELGSAVRHSDRPTAVCMPFMYLPDGTLKSAVRSGGRREAQAFLASMFLKI